MKIGSKIIIDNITGILIIHLAEQVSIRSCKKLIRVREELTEEIRENLYYSIRNTLESHENR